MTPRSASEGLQDWPTIEQAADELKASVRTIWRHNERGLLEILKRPVPGRKPINVCNPTDLNKLKPSPYVVVKDEGAELTGSREAMLPISKVSEAVERIVTIFQERQDSVTMTVPLSQKLWLPLDEAAAYSGLRITLLRDSIVAPEHYQEGENLIGIKGGPHGAWRIQRRSLEAFAG